MSKRLNLSKLEGKKELKANIKYWALFFGIVIIIFGGIGFLGYIIINGINIEKNTKETLCKEKGFNWREYNDNKQRVNECYSINNGIIEVYNLFYLNKTTYLMRGIR